MGKRTNTQNKRSLAKLASKSVRSHKAIPKTINQQSIESKVRL